MINCRYKSCKCMNNSWISNNANSCNIETICNDVCLDKEKYNSNCSCGFDDDAKDVFPADPMLAQSYVPTQFIGETLTPCAGLNNGTIFPELISPYSPLDNMKQIAYIEMTNSPKEGCNS